MKTAPKRISKRLLVALLVAAIVFGVIAYFFYLGCEIGEWRAWLIEGGRC